LFKELGHDGKLKHGQMTKITIEDIAKCLCLVEARIKCADYVNSSSAESLVKVLTEIKKYDLAIQLATKYGVSVEYPVTYLIKEFQERENPENEGEDQWGDSKYNNEMDFKINEVYVATDDK
jgi:hypothetical protein